jgi:hypothetical protein
VLEAPPPLPSLSLVLCHCDVAHSCFANGVEGPQVIKGAANILIGRRWQPTAGGPANWRLGMAYKIARCKSSAIRNVVQKLVIDNEGIL